MNRISVCRLPFVSVTLFILAAFAAAMPAQAQEMSLAPSKALSCLARKNGKEDRIEYPKDALERKDGGVVKVDMTFNAPDRAPRVKVDASVTSSELEDLVKDFVDDYRLPCLDPKNGPVTLHREYDFVPNDGRKVMSTTTRDLGDKVRSSQLACIKNIAGNAKPDYPTQARIDQSQGKFYVDLAFAAPDQPPQLTWLVAAKNHTLRWAVEQYVKDLRMPCQQGEPAHLSVLYQFSIVDGTRVIMKDLSLKQYLAFAKVMPTSVYFDLDKLGCPFDLRVRYLQPVAPNHVSELDNANPARKPFIDWIANISLNFSDTQLSQVIGDSFTVSVPCGKVDL
jgi:hypothetical protein